MLFLESTRFPETPLIICNMYSTATFEVAKIDTGDWAVDLERNHFIEAESDIFIDALRIENVHM